MYVDVDGAEYTNTQTQTHTPREREREHTKRLQRLPGCGEDHISKPVPVADRVRTIPEGSADALTSPPSQVRHFCLTGDLNGTNANTVECRGKK
jgi:hypothetical protein